MTTSQQVTEEALKDKPKRTFEEMVPEPYQDFYNIFSKKSFDELPQRKPWDHTIDLTPGTHSIDCKIYNLCPDKQKKLDETTKLTQELAVKLEQMGIWKGEYDQNAGFPRETHQVLCSLYFAPILFAIPGDRTLELPTSLR